MRWGGVYGPNSGLVRRFQKNGHTCVPPTDGKEAMRVMFFFFCAPCAKEQPPILLTFWRAPGGGVISRRRCRLAWGKRPRPVGAVFFRRGLLYCTFIDLPALYYLPWFVHASLFRPVGSCHSLCNYNETPRLHVRCSRSWVRARGVPLRDLGCLVTKRGGGCFSAALRHEQSVYDPGQTAHSGECFGASKVWFGGIDALACGK